MKNLKFKVQVTPEQSAEIQKAIFEKGGQWADGTTDVKHMDKSFLIVQNGKITYLVTEKEFQNYDPAVTQWFANDALGRIRKSTPMHKYVVDSFDNFIVVRTTTSYDTLMSSREKITKDSPGIAYMWVLGDTTMYNFTREDQPPLVTMMSCMQYPPIMKMAHEYCDKLNYKLNTKG